MKKISNIATAPANPSARRPGSETTLPTTQPQEQQQQHAPHIVRFVDAIVSGLTADTTLKVLDDYRSLGDLESERVYYFLQDALARQKDRAQDAQYTALERFWFAIALRRNEKRASEPERIFRGADLTPEQQDRYVRAWELILSVHEEMGGGRL